MSANSEALARFNAELEEFTLRVAPEAAVQIQRQVATEALSRVVLKTPVDVGRARGNWQTTIGVPASGTLAKEDRSGASAIQVGQNVIGRAKPFVTIFLANNLPYIEVLENGGYVPANPDESEEGRKKRRASRSKRDRRRAKAAVGHEGGALVKDGFSLQAPHGMVGVTVQELLGVFG